MTGKLVILSGPSGVGKDTLIDAWKLRNHLVERVVATTTRPPRPGEVNGQDYVFASESDFLRLVEQDLFLEHKEVHGYHYGTPLESVERILNQGKIAVLKIDVQGALTVMELRPEALSIFILPPIFEDLERRMSGRATDSPEVIARRILNAKEEIAQSHRYRHQVVNDDLEAAVARIEEIVGQ